MLEQKLSAAFDELRIDDAQRNRLLAWLSVLKAKDFATYEHSLRVGLLGWEIAQFMHLDQKALLYSGLLHDLGKSFVDENSLRKTIGFNEQDMAQMKSHPENGYKVLHGLNDFTAEVIVRHHRFQRNVYPEQLPKFSHDYSVATKTTIDFYARLVALADSYDATSTRTNNKFGSAEKLSPARVKELMFEQNPDQKKLVEELYLAGIFKLDVEQPIEVLQKQQEAYNSIVWDDVQTSRAVRRNVQLACALEPLSNKPNCTTRWQNASQRLKLDYFVAGAINVGDTFEDFALRIIESDIQPLLYDIAYRAQLECIKNRCGGRINQGMLEMLIPIVASEVLNNKEYTVSVDSVLSQAVEVMKRTSRSDVDWLVKMKRLAYDLSGYLDRTVPEHINANNVYEYYHNDLAASEKPTSIAHNQEFVDGFPAIRFIYSYLEENIGKPLQNVVKDAYELCRFEMHKGISAGLTADCVAVALYLLLTHHHKERIVV